MRRPLERYHKHQLQTWARQDKYKRVKDGSSHSIVAPLRTEGEYEQGSHACTIPFLIFLCTHVCLGVCSCLGAHVWSLEDNLNVIPFKMLALTGLLDMMVSWPVLRESGSISRLLIPSQCHHPHGICLFNLSCGFWGSNSGPHTHP